MKILITGGSGFLGINLVRHLLANGNHDLSVLDIADFDYPERDRIRFIRGDIRNKNAVAQAVEGIDAIVHTAAALPLYTEEEIRSTDITGTGILLESAHNAGIRRFVHISSTAVYGIPDHHPLLETDRLDGVGPYGEAKIEAERLCIGYRKKGMCIPIIRPKSFIGPERLGVFALFYEWASEGRSFPMIGNGKNRYQLLDVEDLCEVIRLTLTTNAQTVNDTFNIGAAAFTTMKEDYQAVLDEAGFGRTIRSFPAGPVIAALRILEFFRLSPLYKWVYETASKDSFVSIEKAERVIGFRPRFSNKDALVRNFRWYMENRASFKNTEGISHRTPWKQGALGIIRHLF